MIQQFNIPQSWDEVSLFQYQDLVLLNIEGKGIFEKYVEYLSILTQTDTEELEDLDIEYISKIIKNIKWLEKSPSTNYKNTIGDFHLINLNTLTLGAYIDIEYYSGEFFKNLHLIFAILYRKIIKNEWGEIIYEPYEYDLQKRSELFLDESINSVYGVVNLYENFKQNFTKNYSNLFLQEVPEEDLDPIEELTPEDLKEIEKEKERAKWAWESLIYNLCDGDLTNYNKVLNLPLIFVFNQISFKKIFNI
jgi:hypothetical protein